MSKQGDTGISGRSMRGKLGMCVISVLCRCETVKEGIRLPVRLPNTTNDTVTAAAQGYDED